MMLKDWYTEDGARQILNDELAITKTALAKHLNLAYRKGHQHASNYTANDDTYPTEIEFGNGRVVRIVERDGRTFLDVLIPRGT